MARHGLVDRLVRAPAPRPRTRSCPGTTSRPACTRTSSGRTGRTPWPSSACRDCRWTPCYDCGACTGYGIEHVVASAVAARRRQPGHRPGPGPGRVGPVLPRAVPVAARAGSRRVTRVRVRFAKLGKIRWTSHRDMARMWERAFRRTELPLALHRGLLAPAQGQLRAGPLHRPRVGGRVPRRRAGRDGEPVDVDALPGLLSAALPDGVDAAAAAVIGRPSPLAAGGRSPPAAGDRGPAALGAESGPRRRSTPCWPRRGRRRPRQRKGADVTDDIRPGILYLSLIRVLDDVAGPAGGDPVAAAGIELDAELATQPRGLRPAELLAALGPGVDEGRIRRNHQWIERRRRPAGAAAGPARRRRPHALGRAS